MKLNKRGSSYVGLIVSTAIFLALVGIVGQFNVYLARHKQDVREQVSLSQQVSSQIAEVYNEPWDNLVDEKISTDYGDVFVNYELTGETEFATKQLDVTFDKDGEAVTYTLERSVYHE